MIESHFGIYRNAYQRVADQVRIAELEKIDHVLACLDQLKPLIQSKKRSEGYACIQEISSFLELLRDGMLMP